MLFYQKPLSPFPHLKKSWNIDVVPSHFCLVIYLCTYLFTYQSSISLSLSRSLSLSLSFLTIYLLFVYLSLCVSRW